MNESFALVHEIIYYHDLLLSSVLYSFVTHFFLTDRAEQRRGGLVL